MTATDLPGQSYDEILQTLSEASVEQHFDAFTDIDWDNPDWEVRRDDPRWVLPSIHPLGRTAWYQSLPLDRQIEVGIYVQANVAKVGLQFEQVLISGIMNHCLTLPNGRPEFRYSTHEATEECHHTQMFQELVNRTGVDAPGGPAWFRRAAPLLPLAAGPLPFVFFIGVLAGEEPIDHLQKNVLRAGDQMHPMVSRVMQIHVAEEARHIGFAHQYLEHRAQYLNRRQRAVLSIAMPVIMRTLCDVIMKPSKQMQRDLGIPQHVIDEVWWDSPESRKVLRDTFRDVRTLAENLGLMNRTSRRVWRALKIDGDGSRFRSEPANAAT
ncbi:diiron oxygenase [Nocardioides panacisoli]|uniref:AurF N-oxygenase family protein n=1 Tax=Nocardioides panacisoli TaxID=627624 RepID=UPI001C6394ED|nr:diiron oxygenase [Nocardioides panacisoli]QYJ03373.1 diiron oxygenase [Nocardioides panacisoli]